MTFLAIFCFKEDILIWWMEKFDYRAFFFLLLHYLHLCIAAL
jgi:hypothetical protein